MRFSRLALTWADGSATPKTRSVLLVYPASSQTIRRSTGPRCGRSSSGCVRVWPVSVAASELLQEDIPVQRAPAGQPVRPLLARRAGPTTEQVHILNVSLAVKLG